MNTDDKSFDEASNITPEQLETIKLPKDDNIQFRSTPRGENKFMTNTDQTSNPALDKCEHCFDDHICLWCGLVDNQKSVMDIYLGKVKVIYDLKPIRDHLRITQAEVAIMIGVSRLTYIKWENNQDLMPIGKYKETIDNFSKLYQKKL